MTLIELEPVDYYCPTCESAMTWTACGVPSCLGYRCLNCAQGCDIITNPDNGRCARLLVHVRRAILHGWCAE